VARWGYSTSVLAWEFWNEVDLATGYDSRAVAAWHKEMAEYLRSINPWLHPITTSYSRTAGDPEVDGLPQMEFLQSHNYGARDIAGMVNDWSRRQIERYGKPYYLGEYGADVGVVAVILRAAKDPAVVVIAARRAGACLLPSSLQRRSASHPSRCEVTPAENPSLRVLI